MPTHDRLPSGEELSAEHSVRDALTGELTEFERYELREPALYRFRPNRREAMQVLGAGLVIAVTARSVTAQQRGRRGGGSSARSETFSQRFHIGRDGVVTVMTGKVEVGQGSRTQLTQAAAEELQLPLERIRLVMADTQVCPNDGGTAGSQTTPSTVPRVRSAAAGARELLIDLAAKRLGVDRTDVTIAEGVFVAAGGRRLSLAELAADETLLSEAANASISRDGVEVTRVDRWQVLGNSAPKVEGRAVVTGAARYPSDIERAGMLYGKVLRPPAWGAALKEIDLNAAREMEGVTVVRDGDFVGCVAPTSWQAAKGIDALAATAKWDVPAQLDDRQLFDHLKRTARSSGGGRFGSRGGESQDPSEALKRGSERLQESYTVAYIQHAPMEPRAAVAEWADGQLTVWTGSQQPVRVQGQLAEAFRLPQERVRVIVPDTGGGFGGKHTGEAALEAARLARGVKRAVSLRWTREEEFNWAYFRPAGVMEVDAALDDAGRIIAWDFANYNSGGSAIETPYRIPRARSRFFSADAPLRQGSYRALASVANTFARESAMDELAELAKTDPLEFRLNHLDRGRLRDVLQAAARQFDWPRRRAQVREGIGVGLACGTEKGSYVATCAEVQVQGREIKVVRVLCAYECGKIQNPRNLRSQVEGCLVMGLGGALFEEIRFRDGAVTNGRFSAYRVPRMEDLPEMQVELLDRPDLSSVGAGETPIIAIAPAIANAVYHAAGTRLRSMPLRLAPTTG